MPNLSNRLTYNRPGIQRVIIVDPSLVQSNGLLCAGGTLSIAGSGFELYQAQGNLDVTGGMLKLGGMNVLSTGGRLGVDGGHMSMLTGDLTVNSLRVGTTGNGTLEISDFGLDSELAVTGNGSIVVGQNGNAGLATFARRTSFAGPLVVGGSGVGSTGDARFFDPAEVQSIAVGSGGESAQSGTLLIGTSGPDSTGVVTQQGASTLTVGAALGSAGVVRIFGDGVLITGTGSTTVNATGQLLVNSGTVTNTGFLSLLGRLDAGTTSVGSNPSLVDVRGPLAVAPAAIATVLPQATLRLRAGLLSNGGAMRLDGGTLTVNASANFDGPNQTDLQFTAGTLESSGPGASVVYAGAGPFVVPGAGVVRVIDGGAFSTLGQDVRLGDALGGTNGMLITGTNGAARSRAGVGEALVGRATNGTLLVQNGGVLTCDRLTLAEFSTASGSAQIDGVSGTMPANVVVATGVQVGASGNGTLLVLAGGRLNTGTFSLPSFVGTGLANVNGVAANGIRSILVATGAGTIARSGSGSLTVGNGAFAEFARLTISPPSGRNAALLISGASGGFEATLETSNDLLVTSGAPAGAATITVAAGGLLDVGTTLDIQSANRINLTGGRIFAGGGVNLASAGASIAGFGTVTGPVTGVAGSSITATGALRLGSSASPLGFAHAGSFDVAGHLVTVLDADSAGLGVSTTLAGGTLSAVNGNTLNGAGTISGFGYVVGHISGTNAANGLVPTAAAAPLAGNLFVGPECLTVLTNNEWNLPVSTELGDGTLRVTGNGVRLGANEALFGVGTLQAAVAADGGSSIRSTEGLVMGDPSSFRGFVSDGYLYAGPEGTTLRSRGFATLGTLTEIDGGELTAPNGVALGPGRAVQLIAGQIVGKFAGTAGSVVSVQQSSGRVGDPASAAGFHTDGEIHLNQNTLTLDDATEAILGSMTTLGSDVGAGTLHAPHGVLVGPGRTLSGRGTVTAAVTNRGLIHGVGPQPGDGLTFTGAVTAAGSFSGNITFAGVLLPGDGGPGVVRAEHMTLSATNVLMLDVGAPGTLRDHLDASGFATFGGALHVRFLEGYLTLPGQSFEVARYGSHAGDFASTTAVGFAGLRFNRLFGSGALTLIAAATAGDANLDGMVNLADFNTLASNFGGSGRTWLQADFSGDGNVNLADFNLLAARFGLGGSLDVPSPQEWATLAAVVPEPGGSGVALATILGFAMTFCARSIVPAKSPPRCPNGLKHVGDQRPLTVAT